jgi:hypothetical protein
MLPLVQTDDESMSGGDESDDMDLTDGSSYGSDTSEWNEGTPLNSFVPTAASPNKLEVFPRVLNIPSRSATRRSPDIIAFQLAGLQHGLLTLLLPSE